jgi:5-methyltetrahydropteroyltriglutamate--homocysteine methyltransferase
MAQKFRAENVGSLLRPARLLQAREAYTKGELLQAREAHAGGKLALDELRAIEDRAILDAFEGQRRCGIDIFTDGEMRRAAWPTNLIESVEGFVPDHVMLEWKGPGGRREGSQSRSVGAKLRKIRKLTEHELPLLKKSAPGPFKITLPAPSNFVVSSYKPGVTDRVYPTHADLLQDLVEIVRDEVDWLVEQGVRYIQFDAPFYSHYLDPAQRERLRTAGFDPDQEFSRAVAGDNAAIKNVPRDKVTLAVHVCRGNSRSRWYTEGGYDAIAEKLFGELDVDNFLLEYDTERAGGFEPLRFAPRGKTIVLGLVTTKQPELESQDGLRRRIDEAARFVPLENLALSTQCGFASVAAGNLLSMDEQWRKLALVAETARKVWG